MAYTSLEKAKDIANREIAVGSVCIYLNDADGIGNKGDKVVVRAIAAAEPNKKKKLSRPIRLRVDTDVDKPDDADEWTWTAWVEQEALAAI